MTTTATTARCKRNRIVRHRHLEIFAVFAAPCLAICAVVRASAGLDFIGALAAVGGYAVADLLGGVLHWICDDLADPSWPWIGTAFIRPFRDHHQYPEAIVQHDLFELCGNNAMVAALIIGPSLLVASSVPHLVIGVVALAISVLATNLFHSWAHAIVPPAAARCLQRLRIALSPEVHLDHHAALNRTYCVTSGWTNTILDAVICRIRASRASRRRR